MTVFPLYHAYSLSEFLKVAHLGLGVRMSLLCFTWSCWSRFWLLREGTLILPLCNEKWLRVSWRMSSVELLSCSPINKGTLWYVMLIDSRCTQLKLRPCQFCGRHEWVSVSQVWWWKTYYFRCFWRELSHEVYTAFQLWTCCLVRSLVYFAIDERNVDRWVLLLLAGFIHSAFVLGYEASLHKSNIEGNQVPPGALISFVQKGLQYLEMEANLNDVSRSSCQMLSSVQSALYCLYHWKMDYIISRRHWVQ